MSEAVYSGGTLGQFQPRQRAVTIDDLPTFRLREISSGRYHDLVRYQRSRIDGETCPQGQASWIAASLVDADGNVVFADLADAADMIYAEWPNRVTRELFGAAAWVNGLTDGEQGELAEKNS